MIAKLVDGSYPFIDQRLPLSEMTMVEAPPALEAVFKSEAAASGINIIRDVAVELNYQSQEHPDATFLVYWATGTDRIPRACADKVRRRESLTAPRRYKSMFGNACADPLRIQ